MLATCQRHIGDMSTCQKVAWVDMRGGADTKSTQNKNFASEITNKL